MAWETRSRAGTVEGAWSSRSEGPVPSREAIEAEQVKQALPEFRGPAFLTLQALAQLLPALEEPEDAVPRLEQLRLDQLGAVGEAGGELGDLGGSVVVPAFGGAIGLLGPSGQEASLAKVEADGFGAEALEVPLLGRVLRPEATAPLRLALFDRLGHVGQGTASGASQRVRRPGGEGRVRGDKFGRAHG